MTSMPRQHPTDVPVWKSIAVTAHIEESHS